MRHFLKWCETEIHHATLAGLMCLFLILELLVGALVISIAALVSGYWIVPVLVLASVPAAIVITAYINRQD